MTMNTPGSRLRDALEPAQELVRIGTGRNKNPPALTPGLDLPRYLGRDCIQKGRNPSLMGSEEDLLHHVPPIAPRHPQPVQPLPHGGESLVPEEELEGPLLVQGPGLTELSSGTLHGTRAPLVVSTRAKAEIACTAGPSPPWCSATARQPLDAREAAPPALASKANRSGQSCCPTEVLE